MTLTVDEDQKDLCLKISERYELDEIEALILLKSFLQSEDRSLDALTASTASFAQSAPLSTNSRGKRKQGIGEDWIQELLDAFNVFYFEEQLYLTKCVSALLRIAEDGFHEYHSVAQDAMGKFGSLTFGEQCIRTFQTLSQRPLPGWARDAPRYSSYWAKHGLREQIALLEVVFLLFYSHVSADASFIVSILRLIHQTDLGQRQANEAFFNSESAELLRTIRQLLVFIAVETLNLEQTLDGYNLLQQADVLAITQSPDKLNEALELLELIATDAERAPILLAWSLVLQKLEQGLEDATDPSAGLLTASLENVAAVITPEDGREPVWTRLANAAFSPSMDLLPAMSRMAKSPMMSIASSDLQVEVSVASSLAFRAVFKGLLISITDVVKPEYISDYDSLISLWESTFDTSAASDEGSRAGIAGVAALCTQFWENDLQHETRRSLLEMAKRRWPVQFRPLLRLLKALAGGSGAPGEGDLEPALAVLKHFGELTTITQVLPANAGGMRPPWEVIESADHSILNYRATAPIELFGSRLVIQPGTTGRMVSALGQQPVVVVWEPENPVSGWRTVRDVLASFARLLDDSSSSTSTALALRDDNVFRDNTRRNQAATFEALAPEAGDRAVIAADIMDLFSSVLHGAPGQAGALLAHLDSQEELADANYLRRQSTSPTLVAIVHRILDQALASQILPVELVNSAYRLLTILLPLQPSEVWLAMRSSNLIIGTGGQSSWTSRSASNVASAVLTSETNIGTFSATRQLLEFHASLLSELQRSHFTLPLELLQIKVDVMIRALAWLSESIWPEYQTWRYRRGSDRLSIGLSCSRLFESIITDQTARAGAASGPMQELTSAIDNLFVRHTSLSHLLPLTSTIGPGQQILLQLAPSGNHGEAEKAHDLIESSLRLAKNIVDRRQTLSENGSIPHKLGLLEHVFFDGSTVANRAVPTGGRRSGRVELVGAVMGYILQPLSDILCKEASLLITAVCMSVQDANSRSSDAALSIVPHLGSSEELQSIVDGVVDLLDNTHQDANLRRVVWTMAAAMIATQPALATMLLSGQDSQPNQKNDKSDKKRRTALQLARDTLTIWDALWESDPALLDAILHFLSVAWDQLEHLTALESLRVDASFWQSIVKIVQGDTGAVPSEPPSELEETDEGLQSEHHELVASSAHRHMSKARALYILSKDLSLSASNKSGSMTSMMDLASSGAAFTIALEAAVKVQCDSVLHADVEHRMALTFPEMPISVLRNPTKRHEFDLSREYGDDYVYDTRALRTKLEGFCESSDANDDDTIVDDRVITRAVLMLASVNLDWSLIDTQTTCLRAWTSLLESFSRRLRSQPATDSKVKTIKEACVTAWIGCAKETGEETREGNVLLGIHAERLALLEILLETAWGDVTAPSSAPATSSKEDIDRLRQVIEGAQKILYQGSFSLEASVRRDVGMPSFHRNLFGILLLSTRRLRQIMPGSTASACESETHRAVHHAMDLFTSATITSLRQIVEKATAALSTSSEDESSVLAVDEDLTLVCSLLELLIRPNVSLTPHFWLRQFQEVGLLPACVTLLRRASSSSSNGNREQIEQATKIPLFMPAMLSLFLALAAQRESAEQSILAGLMTALLSNALSPTLETGSLAATLPSGQANPVHACWVDMLRLVVSIVENLDGDEGTAGQGASRWTSASVRFIETEVLGFVRLYGAQIGQALSFAPISKRGGPGQGVASSELRFVEGDSTITQPQLNELQATVRLFLVMASAEESATGSITRGGRQEVLNILASKSTAILQQVVFLLQRPHQLASLLVGLGAGEKDEDNKIAQQQERLVIDQMTSIATTIVSALWHQSQGLVLLTRPASEWPTASSEAPLFRPTMRTSPSESASVGTLLELTSYAVEQLQSNKTGEKISMLVEAVEQSLALAVTQLSLNLTKANNGTATTTASKYNVETGIQRDVVSAIQSGLNAVEGAQQSSGGDGIEFLQYLLTIAEGLVQG